MRHIVLAVLSIVCVAAPAVQAQKQIRLFATITDATGSAPARVDPADVLVKEDGADAKTLTVEPINWPIKLQVLIDNGVGMGGQNITNLRNGLRALLEALPERTEVTLVTTAPQPRMLVKATTDRSQWMQGIDRLSPDSGAGRFVESLEEATRRFEQDKTDFFPAIVSFATLAGDANVRDQDVNRIVSRVQTKPTPVYVVLFTGASTSSGGGIQTEIGIEIEKLTQGRFEAIAAISRIVTLLPEIGAQVAKLGADQGGQFRITIERPGKADADFGKITLSMGSGLRATNVRFASAP